MMKKKILKALAIVGCAVLLVAGSIAGTFAYLTSQTQTVTNTFTAGKVAITLDEAVLDANGVATGDRGTTGNSYKLIPGKTYPKDPTIHVEKGSEKCYLYVKVENDISGIEIKDSSNSDKKTIVKQMEDNRWIKLEGVDNVYYQIVDASEATENIDINVFRNFTIDTSVTGQQIASSSAQTVKVTAYAIQADGFETAQAAWTALNQQLNLNH